MKPGPGNMATEASSRRICTLRTRTDLLKQQATSFKPQAQRFKLQAASDELHDSQTLIKFHASSSEVLDHDKCILWM